MQIPAINRSDIQLFVERHLNKIEESMKQLAASKGGRSQLQSVMLALLRNVQKIKRYYGKDADDTRCFTINSFERNEE